MSNQSLIEKIGGEWRPVPEFPKFWVSSAGVVIGPSGRVRKPVVANKHGHQGIVLYDGGKHYHRYIHRMVMEAFVGPRPDGMEVRHLNGDPSDNRLDNLVYGTHAENMQDAIAHGTHYSHGRTVTACPQGHAYDEDNTCWMSRPNGKKQRACRACRREQNKRRYTTQKGRQR